MKRALVAVALSLLGGPAHGFAAGLTVIPWGITDKGEPVEKVTVENDLHMRASYIAYGATITALNVPDRQGKTRNVLLSLPDLPAYEHTHRRFAAAIGRYAGRLSHGEITIDGKTFKLAANAKGLLVHSDPLGFDHQVWSRRDFTDEESIGSVYHLLCPDGQLGLPGNLSVNLTYRLMRKSNRFRIEYDAETDAPTVINFTNHGFFNMAGAGTTGLATNMLRIDADRYLETAAYKVPTGNIVSVEGTVLDFRNPTELASRIASGDPLLAAAPPGVDHTLVFTHWTGDLAPVATVDDTLSGRRMVISTTEPSAHLFTGNGFDGSEIGSEGYAYQRYDGFAFETQHLPDAPNHPNFPSTELRPGDHFHSVTEFAFSIVP